MKIDWQIGPARTRDGREARIYATDGMGEFSIHGAILTVDGYSLEQWTTNGRHLGLSVESRGDLIPPAPPTLSREEVARECQQVFYHHSGDYDDSMRAALDHYDELVKAGRVE